MTLEVNYNGGLTISQEMQEIIAQPGFISVENGGQILRDLYFTSMSTTYWLFHSPKLLIEKLNFDPFSLSPFAGFVFFGFFDQVKQVRTFLLFY